MGRMKQVFIKMQEENYKGDPQEYVKRYAEELIYSRYMADKDPFLCPNCLTTGLIASVSDLECPGCGYEFIQVDGSIRFK